MQLNWRPVDQLAKLDAETLGGYITCATILAAVTHLSGDPGGLVIHDPERPSVPVAQVDD